MSFKQRSLVAAEEQSKISRGVLSWLNTCPFNPDLRMSYELLGDEGGLALSTTQAAYKTASYIYGGYRAQYQFRVIYRLRPETNDERLSAEEIVNSIGAWAEVYADLLKIDGICIQSVRRDTVAALYARYEGGVEDYQILMTMIYEVNV